MNDLAAALSCQALYSAATPLSVGGVFYQVDGSDITLMGSKVTRDWVRDFCAIPVRTRLGTLHLGFWEGMEELYAAVKGIKNPRIRGHSLGGSHSRILAGQFIADGNIPAELVTFAAPRPGFEDFKALIDGADFPHRNYRFCNDPVPLVPVPVPLIAHWEHTEPWIELRGAGNLDWFEDHHIQNYVSAVTPLAQAA